jgi:hypothetical protein
MTFNQALQEAKKLAKGSAYAVRREVFFYSNGERSIEVQVYLAGMSEIFTGKTYEEAVQKAAAAIKENERQALADYARQLAQEAEA